MRRRGAALGVLVGLATPLVVTGVADAATATVAAGSVSLNAPVGIAAVAFGVVGLVTGLVRRRKAAADRAEETAAAVVATATASVAAVVPVVAPDVEPATTQA
ncbi:hypothetical protein [Actinosynnema sp. NPDC020468]|uniref:hypothetical protein n=1 Tax=Actinosynnema sp. NPDC020468 TaxID=3154488 RepID=UPI0033F4C412